MPKEIIGAKLLLSWPPAAFNLLLQQHVWEIPPEDVGFIRICVISRFK